MVGDRELESGRYTVRDRAGDEHADVSFERLVERLEDEARTRRLTQSVFAER